MLENIPLKETDFIAFESAIMMQIYNPVWLLVKSLSSQNRLKGLEGQFYMELVPKINLFLHCPWLEGIHEESLTVTNRAVQLLVEKSGLADVPLRESLMLVWGRRFSCDVATGMIPLGDLLLGSAWILGFQRPGAGWKLKDLERLQGIHENPHGG